MRGNAEKYHNLTAASKIYLERDDCYLEKGSWMFEK